MNTPGFEPGIQWSEVEGTFYRLTKRTVLTTKENLTKTRGWCVTVYIAYGVHGMDA